MKRFLVFILLGPVLFVLCIWALFLPAASLTEGAAVRFNIEVDFRALLFGVMFGGFVLALLDWLAEILVMRPWFTALAGWAVGCPNHRSVVRPRSQPIWWWFIVKGLLVGIPAFVCSWLVKRIQNKAQRPA